MNAKLISRNLNLSSCHNHLYLYVWSDNFLYLRVCKVNPNKPKQKKERNSRHAFSLINPNPMSDSEPRRRRRKPKSLSERVPYDVVIDILSRLPVKSLIRFRRVSKSWYSVITDPFLLTNTSTSTSTSTKPNHYPINNGKELRTVVCNSDHTATEISILKIPFYLVNVISLCNGIFCLESYDNRHVNTILYLWNPSTRKFKMLFVPYNNYHYAYSFTLGLAYQLSLPKQ